MLWMGLALASIFLVAATATVMQAQFVRRRFRRSGLLIGVTVATAIIAAPTLIVTTIELTPLTPVTLGLSVVAMLALGEVGVASWRPTSRSERPKRILVVGAHPDDIELACGGSLARFIDRGHEVHVLVMSQGARGGAKQVRAGEAISAANFLDVRDITVVDFTDTSMATEIA